MATPDTQLDYLYAQQASDWIQILRQPSQEQRAAFVAWLKESPRNVREFLLMFTVDRALDQIDAKHSQSIEALLAQVDRQVVQLSKVPPATASVSLPPHRWRRAALAASITAAALAAYWLLAPHEATWRQFETATGEQRAFELEDGSVIHLNTHSHVAVHLWNRGRDVRLLEGEALFRVHHDTDRVFRVYTNDAVIQAVGTQFNVYNRPDGTVVAVIEGRVNVTPQPHAHLPQSGAAGVAAGGRSDAVLQVATRSLGANEEAQINRAGSVSVRSMTDTPDAIAWQERRLVFHQQTLGRIVEEFNRYNRQQIRLDGAELANRIYTGVFDADDPESLADVLADDNKLAVEKSDRIIVIRAR